MSDLISFDGYAPAPRYDSQPWQYADICESDSEDGIWSTIQTFTLDTLDDDPSEPQNRSFSTKNATLDLGWYKIVFRSDDGARCESDPVQNAPSDEQDWLPTNRDLALKILSRTRDSFGNQKGVFTEDTTPNAIDASAIIRRAGLDVADVIGDDVPQPLLDDAANVTALRAAMLVETTYYSEQVNTGRSIYPQLKEDYMTSLANLQRQMALIAEGETRVTQTGATKVPSGNFPDPGIGFGTRW